MAAMELETIYAEHSRMVYWAAYGILRSEIDARDVVQNTFLRAIRHMPSLEGMNEGQLRGWLYRVAVNLCYDHVRRLKREAPAEELPDTPSQREYELPEAAAVSAEQRRLVREAIEALPEKYRRAVMLHYYSNLSYAEIAALDGVSESAIKSRVFRAKEMLMRQLKGGGLDG